MVAGLQAFTNLFAYLMSIFLVSKLCNISPSSKGINVSRLEPFLNGLDWSGFFQLIKKLLLESFSYHLPCIASFFKFPCIYSIYQCYCTFISSIKLHRNLLQVYYLTLGADSMPTQIDLYHFYCVHTRAIALLFLWTFC